MYDQQGRNFITTLHRGQLDIIPWPVIQSPEFYTQMRVLKARLDEKPFAYGSAASFLRTLKLLMARLKVNTDLCRVVRQSTDSTSAQASDWASLDREYRIKVYVEKSRRC